MFLAKENDCVKILFSKGWTIISILIMVIEVTFPYQFF